MRKLERALSFDDVLLVPRFSEVISRSEISLHQKFLGFNYTLPIISANMSTVTEREMATAMHLAGGMGIIHRMCNVAYQCQIVKDLRADFPSMPIVASIETSPAANGIHRADHLLEATCDILCVDVAHAHSNFVICFVQELLRVHPGVPLILGNIATFEAARHIKQCLADSWHDKIALKVGVGSGSQCTTRIVTGCGLPTLASLFDIGDKISAPIIADGGIKNSGDIVKSLCAGANMVMVGSLLAGTKEAPGSIIKQRGERFKVYRGSASYGQKNDVNLQGYIEGEESLVPYKGSADKILKQLEEGIKSGLSYVGARNLADVFKNSPWYEFVEITHSGFSESKPHGAL